MSIWKYLGLEPQGARQPGSAGETETVRRITRALDRLEPERARYIAAFAYILSRVARADLDVSEQETREMERLVAERGGLTEEQAIIVVQMARSQNLLFGGTENFLVTREFNRIATREQKRALLDCLFAVSASDDSISSVEDNEIRQIATELAIEHADFIASRSPYRDRLESLRRLRSKEP